MKRITTPIRINEIANLKVGDKILISGTIYTGRDAALPQLVNLIKENNVPFDLEGIAIMHTAVSDAGISPTTSNKEEIEGTMPFLSQNGVRLHIGKGSLSDKTKEELYRNNSIFAITPPAAALLTSKIIRKECVLFENEGIEAMFRLEVHDIPAIVAVSNKKSI